MFRMFEDDHVEIPTHETNILDRPAPTGNNFISNPCLKMLKKKASICEIAEHGILKKLEGVLRNLLGVCFHVIE